jgi:IS30 family transposase
MRISHEAIYEYVYILPRGELKNELVRGMRREHKFRYKRANRKKQDLNTPELRGKNPGMVLIDERPREVEDRALPGHWEGDLILGKFHQSALGTLVERTTRFTILVPLKAKDGASVRKAYERAFKTLPSHLCKTLTYDQGREMVQHKLFTQRTKIQVYFAHPNSPWERGTNENTNGLIRQFFPKGTNFKDVGGAEIRRVEHLLNERPRKILNWYTPKEIFNSLLR